MTIAMRASPGRTPAGRATVIDVAVAVACDTERSVGAVIAHERVAVSAPGGSRVSEASTDPVPAEAVKAAPDGVASRQAAAASTSVHPPTTAPANPTAPPSADLPRR